MDEINKDKIYKITFMGLTGSGKTSIINRLINNTFYKNYIPTLELKNYFFEHFITSGYDVFQGDSKKTVSIKLLLEDVFGLDNQLIKTTENKIRSGIIKEYRDTMLTQFNDIMHSIYNPKDQPQIEKSNKIAERLAFVFVVDVTGDAAQFKQVISVIKAIHEAEINSKRTLKCLILNKIDLSSDFSEDNFADILEKIKINFKCLVYSVSALSMENLRESMNKLFNSCYELLKLNKAELTLNQDADQQSENVGCNRFVSCQGNGNIFTCGVKYFYFIRFLEIIFDDHKN